MLINGLISTVSYFFIFLILYHLFRRHLTAPLIAFLMFFTSSVSHLLSTDYSNLDLTTGKMVLIIIYTLSPPVISFVLLLVYGGYFNTPIVRKRKLKHLSTDIYTKAFVNLAILNIIGSLVLAFFSIYQFDGYQMIIGLVISGILLIVFLYAVIQEKKIISRSVILLVGKESIDLYNYEIPKNKRVVTIRDFYKDDRYIADKIGEVRFIREDLKHEMHYLYWIATQQNISMENEPVKFLPELPYQQVLDMFEKYHYHSMTIKKAEKGCIILKDRLIR